MNKVYGLTLLPSTVLPRLLPMALQQHISFFGICNVLGTLNIISLSGQILIVGDVNLHLDNTSNNQTREFLELLDTLNLRQLVNQPTHRLDHTLDCIITQQDANLVNDIQTFGFINGVDNVNWPPYRDSKS